MREIIESLTTCTIISVYTVVGIAIASGLVSIFGVPLQRSRFIVMALVGVFFLTVSFTQVIESLDPTLDALLFVVFLVCVGAGAALAQFTPYRSWSSRITPQIKWSVFAFFVYVMAALVGKGYPANPLAAVELVHQMRNPLWAVPICILAALIGFALGSHCQHGDTLAENGK